MIVLDACAAIEMVRQTPVGNGLQSLMLCNEKVIAPELYRVEVGSVVRKIRRSEHLDKELANRYYDKVIALVDDFVPTPELSTEAFAESLRLDHSTYDMLYFVLARRTMGTLFTLDKRLIALCEQHGVNSIDLVPFNCGEAGN